MTEISEVGYIQVSGSFTEYATKNSWQAQVVEWEKPAPPSVLNLILASLSLLFCPCLGCLACIYAIKARTVYSKGSYSESKALCTRARGTALYAIAIGISLGVGYGVLLWLGSRYDWY